MKNYAYIAIAILTLLGMYFFLSNKSIAKDTFLIQIPLDMTVIKEMQDSMTEVVNGILTEEVGVHEAENWALFFFKKRQAITVYYVNDISENGKKFLDSAFASLPTIIPYQNVRLTSKLDFFGEDTEGIIHLVGLVDDANGELSFLNTSMKNAMHNVNTEYQKKYHTDLYDISKSEQYPFLPHISLGHLRVNLIKKIQDGSNASEVVDRIKKRIIEAVSLKLLELLTRENSKVSFTTLSIYDLLKRAYIEEKKIV